MRKEPCIDGAEMDWKYWRGVYAGDTRGVGRYIKRKMNKRARRKGKREIRDESIGR